MTEEKQQCEKGSVVGLQLFWKKSCFKVGFERALRGVLSERKGKVIPSTMQVCTPTKQAQSAYR